MGLLWCVKFADNLHSLVECSEKEEEKEKEGRGEG